MNFKRILVLVMALVMTVSAFAPSIQAFNKDDAKAELDRVIGDVESAIYQIVDYVSENYEDAYADGYAYALENGYINDLLWAIDEAVAAIEVLDVSSLGVEADLAAALETELDATVDTLCELEEVLAQGTAVDFAGLVVALVGFEDDLYTHLENLEAVCAEVEVDLAKVENALSSLELSIDNIIEAAKDYLAEALAPYYDVVCDAFDFGVEVYNIVVETVVAIHATVLRVHAELLRVNETILDAMELVENTIKKAVDTYVRVASALVNVYDTVEVAVKVAKELCENVVVFVDEYKDEADSVILQAKKLYNGFVEILVKAQAEHKKAQVVACEIYAYVVELIGKINAELGATLDAAFNANYVLNENSYYVALGNSKYASELANMLNLSNKYKVLGLNGSVAGADLVTVDMTDDELYDFTYSQVLGKVASIVRENDILMRWYNDGGIVGSAIRGALEDLGIDVNANAKELDWSKYLDEEGVAMLDSLLENLQLEIVEAGVPEVYVLPLGELALEVLKQNGYYFPGVSINIFLDIPVAELISFAFENMLYKYAEFASNVAMVLDEVHTSAPNATVVLTGVAGTFEVFESEFAELGLELDFLDDAFEAAAGTLNVGLFALALARENTIFVEEANAEAIFEALNYSCAHVYDDYCLDTTCNLCGEVREAPGHTFENYVSNGDATCNKNGTETAKCEYCDVTDTKEEADSKIAHDYSEATCETPKTCKNCGHKIEGYADHVYGEWKTTISATNESTGIQEKVCTVCGHKVEEVIPMIPDNTPGIMKTIGIVILVAAVVSGAVVGAYCLIKKKKNA